MVREDSISYLRIDKERSQEWPSVAQPYVSAAPSGHMGYSQSKATLDVCFNFLVRPARISPRQSGAAGPCSTLRGWACRALYKAADLDSRSVC